MSELRITLTAVSAAILLAAAPARAGSFELLATAGTLSATAEGGTDDLLVLPPGVSADGRWIAFTSHARNLVPGQQDVTAGRDVFLHDRQTGTTVLVSHAFGSPASGGGNTSGLSISADGRWIAYDSTANSLVPGQLPGDWSRVYLYDRDTGLNALVAWEGDRPEISADGLWITFESRAPNLVPGQLDLGFTPDVFLHERAAQTTRVVSRKAGTTTEAVGGFSPSLSVDGRYVVFVSESGHLVAGFTGSPENVFLFDRDTDAVTLVSHTSASATAGAGGDPRHPTVSADGSVVAFLSRASDLVPGVTDTNGDHDVFLFDRASGANTLVSRSAAAPTTAGNRGADTDSPPQVSSDGAWVAFAGKAGNAIPGQGNNNFERPDVFLFERATAALTMVSHNNASATQDGNSTSEFPRLSADGRFVVYRSHSTNLVPGQTDTNWVDDQIGGPDMFLFDRTTGANTLLSGAGGSASATGNEPSRYPALSADGTLVAFSTAAEDLVPGVADLNMEDDLILHDRQAGTSEVATLHAPGLPSGSAAEGSRFLSASADGRFAVFLSQARNLVPGQTAGRWPRMGVFLRDRQTGSTVLVSHAAGSATAMADADSSGAAISADGAWVVFASAATDLVAGQNDVNQHDFHSEDDVFLYERATGTVTLVSHAAGSTTTTGSLGCDGMSISADGRYVAFACEAPDLIAGQVDDSRTGDVFLHDRVAGTTVLASRSYASAVTAVGGVSPVLSPDGRWLAFVSYDGGLIFGSVGGGLFLYDRVTGQVLLVSRAAGTANTPADNVSGKPVLSPDGRYVAFTSHATNLVPGQSDGGPFSSDADAFLFDRVTGTVELISRAPGSSTVTGNDESEASAVSADGRYVAFTSRARDLVPGQSDGFGTWDVFLHDRATRITELITRSGAEPAAALGVGGPALLSADGRWLAFISTYSPHVLHLADRQLHSLERVAPADGFEIALSADGGTLHFTVADARNADDFNGASDAYAYLRASAGESDFFTVVPCRLLDTRQAGGGPALGPEDGRLVAAHGACGIPSTATALVVNVTVTGATHAGFLTLHPGNLFAPGTSTVNFGAGSTRANNAVVPLAFNGDGTLALSPFLANGGSVHAVVDVTGYFQ